MSDPTASSRPAGSKEEGISKYMKRMKTVLRSGTRSARNSVTSLAEITGNPSRNRAAAVSTDNTPPLAPVTIESARPPVNLVATIAPASTVERAGGQVRIYHWSTMQEERARALFAKYGLTLEPTEWTALRPTREHVERIERPIRMRVRRNCHRCLTTFGSTKVCIGCSHIRCNKCFRYPPAKESEERDQIHEQIREIPRQAEPIPEHRSRKYALTIPSRTGGQDLVRKPILQRVRRTCHMCSTLFIGSAMECRNCNHIRCKKCPRDPAKKHKYPDGYPGDAEPPFELPERVWRKPRRRIRWTCDSCSSVFPSGKKTCPKCHHERCRRCLRDPPKKYKPEPDPELLRRVEEKLAAFNVS